jgi:hypothetical protein
MSFFNNLLPQLSRTLHGEPAKQLLSNCARCRC